MSTSSALILNIASLTSHSHANVNGSDANPQATPGSWFFMVDKFGPRILKYVRNRNGSDVTMGELMAAVADSGALRTTAVTNITAGSTTSATTSGLTANDHDGMIAYVFDNNDSAGAAPEGESSIVASNTTTEITMENDYPYSVALAVNDDLELIANWQVEDAADGDLAWVVEGVVVGKDGIADGEYGWVQQEGPISADISTSLITEGDPVVAGAAVLDAFGSDGQELWCGVAMATATSDQAAQTLPVWMKLMTAAGPGTAP